MSQNASMFRVQVIVTLKKLVNDPAGIEIRNGLHNLGYEEVDEVRAGKHFELMVAAASADEARARTTEMSERLLCNTVIEEYRVVVLDESAVS